MIARSRRARYPEVAVDPARPLCSVILVDTVSGIIRRLATPKKPADFISIDEAIEEFGVGRASVFRYIAAGKLRRYRRGMDRKSYIDRRQIERLLAFRKEE